MPVPNSHIGQLFNSLADLLEIEGANPFRVRAYRNAARVVSQFPKSFSEILSQGEDIPKLPGLGEDLRGKVKEIATTGRLKSLSETEKRVPKGLSMLLKIPGLGPKRVLALRNRFQIRDKRDLKTVVQSGRLRELKGFGEKIESKILEELQRAEPGRERIKLSVAEQIAKPLLRYLRATSGVKEAIVAGSYRRRQETIGDLDILVSCSRASAARELVERFVHYDEVERILAQGTTKSTVLLRFGVQVDLRIVSEESYGAALHYFTGSKAHNIAVRMLGVRRGLKINEYGVFRGKRRIAGRTEEEVYRAVDLPYIEPELREMRGELEAAQANRLPRLITLSDIRGDLHAHTSQTDGRLGLEEIAERAKERGYSYLAITDHSKHLTVAKGLDPRRLAQQLRAIDRYNEKSQGFRLLKSAEVDILEDGSLDLPDSILKELDLTVCSVHFKFELSEKKQTERILRAMDNRYFTILGHPSGRLIDERKASTANIERVIEGARQRGCFLEVNAQPDRMDLTDLYCRVAKDEGVKLALSTDTHQESDLEFMRFGIDQARRGWIEADDVLNTLPWDRLEELIRRRR
ncbi:MAG: DNA polymerase/3'-5' exonuclease PolX [Bdellovibrionota bacterium]